MACGHFRRPAEWLCWARGQNAWLLPAKRRRFPAEQQAGPGHLPEALSPFCHAHGLTSRLLARPAAPILRALLGPGINPRPRRTSGIGRGWKRPAGLDPRPLEISAATWARSAKSPVVSMT